MLYEDLLVVWRVPIVAGHTTLNSKSPLHKCLQFNMQKTTLEVAIKKQFKW